jgi:hypothetical protein
MIQKEIKRKVTELNRHYAFIENFVKGYCKDKKDIKEFNKHLFRAVTLELELEKECNV